MQSQTSSPTWPATLVPPGEPLSGAAEDSTSPIAHPHPHPHHVGVSPTQLFATPSAAGAAATTSLFGGASVTTPSGHHSLDEPSPSLSWRPDEFVLNQGYQVYREELRCLIFSAAQSAAPTREGSPVGGGGHEAADGKAGGGDVPAKRMYEGDGSGGASSEEARVNRQTAKILAAGRRVVYLRNYVDQVAPWLDMFDSDRAFGMQVPSLARASPALLYAILALSARQLERKEARKESFDSLELYQEAIRLLAPHLQNRDLESIPICVVLCCLEMMSASAQDWRRHLEGCAALFSTFGVNGFSGGLLQAVFWCYARMDGTESTLLQPSKWLPPDTDHKEAARLFRGTGSPDMYANYAVYLCSRVCELISDRTRHLELGEQNGCAGKEFEERWLALWDEVQAWLENRPTEFLPIKTVDAKPFPQILFLHWASISSNQLHHTASILLLSAMPRSLKLNLKLGVAGSTLWHAKRICGISLTNPHQGCLNNAIQPLWVAGRLLSHESEHSVIVKLIWHIESLTGWGSSWRIADLKTAWGHRVRRGNGTIDSFG